MRARWQGALGLACLLLAPAARAQQGAAVERAGAAPERVAPAGEGSTGPAAPAREARAAPARPPTTWSEPAWDEPEAKPSAPRHAAPPTRWYGWQILLSDLASFMLGQVTREEWVMAPGYLLAPPLIHLAHGQGERALVSLGLRVGMPLLGYVIAREGERSCSGDSLSCGFGALVTGFVVGLSGMGIDAALASEPLQRAKRVHTGWAPSIVIREGEARFGVAGSF